MVNFFWQKGFYINQKLIFYSDTSLYTFTHVSGISHTFIKLFGARCEGFSVLTSKTTPTAKKVLTLEAKASRLCNLTLTEKLTLSTLLARTLPVLLDIKHQLRFNMHFFFFTRTYRGFALRLGRPLRRKTRGRTFYRRNMGKPANTYKQTTSTSRWF